MTYREKLKKEHPEDIDSIHVGGCYSCPDKYGYCDEEDTICGKMKDFRFDNKKCTKCWDQTIPGTEKKIIKLPPDKKELKAMRAVFKDGHVEEIFYCSGYDHRYPIEFATKSGMYVYHDHPSCFEIWMTSPATRVTNNHFYKLKSRCDGQGLKIEPYPVYNIDHIEFEEVKVNG